MFNDVTAIEVKIDYISHCLRVCVGKMFFFSFADAGETTENREIESDFDITLRQI